ncbi:MAG: hypothetical protein IJA55_06965 [Clostridia bacterium]|nr:hypothetical protein [Clostridia bacterium]
MTEKLLISLRYPKIDFQAVDELLDGAVTEKTEEKIKSCLDRINDPINKGGYKPIEGRNKSKHRFIQLVREFSEDFEIDLDVTETDICIIADFYFDTVGYFSHLITAMIMADNIFVTPQTTDERSILSLIYNTHSKSPKC